MHVLPWNQTVFALNYRVILFSLPFSAIFIQKREQPTRNKTEGHDLEFEPRFRFGDWQHPSWTNKILHWISRPYFLFTPGRKEESGQSSMCITFCNFNQIFWINSRMRWIYVKIPFSKENRQLCLIFKDGWRRYIFNSNSFQENVKSLLPKRIGIFMHVDLIIWRFYTRFWNDRSGQATEKQGCQEWTLTRLPPIPTIDSLWVPRLVQLLTDEGFHTLQINLRFLFQLFNISKSRSGSNWKLMAR